MKWFDVFKIISTVLFLFGKFLKPSFPRIERLSTELLINKFIAWQVFCEHLLRYWSQGMNTESTLKELATVGRKEFHETSSQRENRSVCLSGRGKLPERKEAGCRYT